MSARLDRTVSESLTDPATEEKAASFSDVFASEMGAIKDRRKAIEHEEPTRANLRGLALSGGGIRSATFCLGVLQKMAKAKELEKFDYLSTVSGGGFIGGFWSAHLARLKPKRLKDPETLKKNLFPQAEKIIHGIEPDQTQHRRTDALFEGSLYAMRSNPIRHLRNFSNYLTPRVGWLSHDTWRAANVFIRNMVLNWMALLPILVCAVLLGQLVFALQPGHGIALFMPEFEGVKNEAPPIPPQMQASNMQAVTLSESGPTSLPTVQSDSAKEAEQQKLLDSIKHLEILRIRELETKSTMAPVEKTPTQKAPRPTTPATSKPAQQTQPVRPSVEPATASATTTTGTTESRPAGTTETKPTLGAETKPANSGGPDGAKQQELLHQIWAFRMHFILRVAGGLLCMTILLTGIWLYLGNQQGLGFGFLFMLAVAGCMGYLLFARAGPTASELKFDPDSRHPEVLADIVPLICWCALALAVIYHCLVLRRSAGLSPLDKLDVRRNRVVRQQTTFLTSAVMAFTILCTVGFGYDIVSYLFFDGPIDESTKKVLSRITALVGTLSTAYTAYTRFPIGGAERPKRLAPKGLDALITSVAATIVGVFVILWVGFAAHWISVRMLLLSLEETSHHSHLSIVAAILLLWLARPGCVAAAAEKPTWRERLTATLTPVTFEIAVLVYAIMALAVVVYAMSVPDWRAAGKGLTDSSRALLQAALVGFSALVLALSALAWWRDVARRRVTRKRAAFVLVIVPILAGAVMAGYYYEFRVDWMPYTPQLAGALAGLLLCAWHAAADLADGTRRYRRERALVSAAAILLTPTLLIHLAPVSQWQFGQQFAQSTLTLIALATVWIVSIGWITDPNRISLHEFYKVRLVRAYLGATNRKRSRYEISQAAPKDDLPLADIDNTRRGGPFHIINATLNMTAGRDLSTAQRNADLFILTPHYCGSLRTCFRETRKYMGNRMTLGSAIAISGAAVSPNMGSSSPSGSVAALLAFLNIRVGYWAPTPDQLRWRESSASLWPFYAFLEFLSNTNNLQSYCYLTDGGHFDNTGAYSLIQRGCSEVVVVDCGADPRQSFNDMGNMMRRCRIDFQCDIEFGNPTDAPMKDPADPMFMQWFSTRHCMRGRIKYHKKHMKQLGRPEVETEGVIYWIKPSLNRTDALDVMQYAGENPPFPQQTTADQWFDEAQFESYRKLGNICGEAFCQMKQNDDQCECGICHAVAANGKPAARPLHVDQVPTGGNGHAGEAGRP